MGTGIGLYRDRPTLRLSGSRYHLTLASVHNRTRERNSSVGKNRTGTTVELVISPAVLKQNSRNMDASSSNSWAEEHNHTPLANKSSP